MNREAAVQPAEAASASLGQLAAVVVFSGITCASMALPMMVLPSFIHDVLGFDAFITGVAISSFAITTLLSRPLAGRISDRAGAKTAVTQGIVLCGLSGLLVLLATLLPQWPLASLALLVTGRLILGTGLALTNTATMGWLVTLAGVARTGRVISYNGVMAYGAIALAPPLGLWLCELFGLWMAGASVLLINLFGLLWVRGMAAPQVPPGAPLAFAQVFRLIASLGAGVALGSLALPAIATFGSLYFSQQRWESPALLMTSFGSAYIGVRLLGGDLLQRVGAKRVAVGCFLVETAGLVVLWLAPSASVAIAGAALSGIGMSLLYPALAVEVVARVPASSRGSALGAFSMCLDVATAVAGPICGAVATLTDDFRDAYAFSVLLCMVGLLVALRLRWSAH